MPAKQKNISTRKSGRVVLLRISYTCRYVAMHACTVMHAMVQISRKINYPKYKDLTISSLFEWFSVYFMLILLRDSTLWNLFKVSKLFFMFSQQLPSLGSNWE